jgi:transposase-like protein
MIVRIAGKRMYLWRAVDHEGKVISHRNRMSERPAVGPAEERG